MNQTAMFLAASLILSSFALAEDKPKENSNAVERMLYGTWQGGLCVGELTFDHGGTFHRARYSPGKNDLTGTWEVKWDALPPTMVMTCTNSDAPRFIGHKEEVKLLQLGGETLVFQFPNQGGQAEYSRSRKPEERELAALQGTWVPLRYEEGGKLVEGELNFKQIVQGDKVIFQVNGETKAEGKVVVDATANPKRLDFQFTSGQTDLIIYVRAGNYITYCGNRDGKTRPTEFVSGAANGGEYLTVWKIQEK